MPGQSLFIQGMNLADARLASSGTLATNSNDPGDIRLGVLYTGQQTLIGATSGLNVTVLPFHFVGSKAYSNGAYLGFNPSTATVAVPAAPTLGLKRIDVLYVVQQDPNALVSPDAAGVNACVFGVHPGVASSSPSKPALTDAPAAPVGAVEVGTITWDSMSSVPTATNASVAGGSCTLATTCQWTALRGNPIPVRNSTEQGALTAYDGLATWRLDTHRVEVYCSDAAMWAPSATGLHGAGWGSYATAPYAGTFARRGPDGNCQVRGIIYRTDPTYSTTALTWYTVGFVPTWMAPTDAAQFTSVLTNGVPIQIRIVSGGAIEFQTFTSQTITQNATSFPIDCSWWR